MEVEFRSLPQSTQSKLRSRLQAHKVELAQRKKELNTASLTGDRSELLGSPEDVGVTTREHRDRLLAANQKMADSTQRIRDANKVALESEELGRQTLIELHRQKEVLLHTRDNVRFHPLPPPPLAPQPPCPATGTDFFLVVFLFPLVFLSLPRRRRTLTRVAKPCGPWTGGTGSCSEERQRKERKKERNVK